MNEPKSRPVYNNLVRQSAFLQRTSQTVAIAMGLCAAALPVPSQSQTQAPEPSALRIEATGFDDASGNAIAKLFLPGQNVRQHGHLEIKAIIKDGKAFLTFPALAPGDYAVVVFHDSNDNGEMDHNLIGLPKEQLGFSGGFKMSLSSGLPTFDKLKFAHGASDQIIAIRVEGL